MTASSLPAALRAGAEGLYALEAAAGLITAHGTWLARGDYAGFIYHGAGTAAIDWEAAISALDGGGLPSSGGERRILRLAASLAGQAPVSLGEAITGIDPLTELPREAARFGGQPAGAVGTFPAHGHRRRVTQGPGIAGRSPRGFASGYRRPVGAVSAA